MKIELSTVDALSPDESSITAAKKLAKPANWQVLEKKQSLNIIWGECKGSGSKPYKTIANIADQSYKCSCPSRKLPCKHTLALLRLFATDSKPFTEAETPQWVTEWVERTEKSKALKEKKALNAAKVLTPEEQEKKEKAARKRAETARKKTVAGVTLAMEDLQQWVDNQLNIGFAYFIEHTKDECEKIAARMADAKAAAIALRIRDIPEKVSNAEASLQLKVAFQELAKLALLAKYWVMTPDDTDLFQSIVTTQKKDSFIDSEDSKEIQGQWIKVAQRVDTKLRGLTSNESWYLKIDQAEPVFAMTLDYYRKKDLNQDEWYRVGDVINASFQYYPSRYPMRSIIKNDEKAKEDISTQWHLQHKIKDVNAEQIWHKHAQTLKVIPWQDEVITIVENGYITKETKSIEQRWDPDVYWWVSKDQKTKIKLTNTEFDIFFLGCTWQRAVIITNGTTGQLCSAYNETWGFYNV